MQAEPWDGWDGGDISTRTQRVRTLRSNMTDAERKLWQGLRGRQMDGHKFRRQLPIGPYIVDFACLDARLIIEVDGGQHLDNPTDQARDAWLAAEGYRVLRYWDNDVLTRTEAVLEDVWAVLHGRIQSSPPPHPSPLKGEGEASRSSAGEMGGFAPSPLRGEGRDGGEAGAAGPANPSEKHDL